MLLAKIIKNYSKCFSSTGEFFSTSAIILKLRL